MTAYSIAKDILELSKDFGMSKPFLVGGIPRDVAMGLSVLKTNDIDITTNDSEAPRLGLLFAKKSNSNFIIHDDNHVTVFHPDYNIDFSSAFISEKVSKLLDDSNAKYAESFSRDFTINTLQLDILSNKIIDPTNMGLNDLKNKMLRTPVSPDITLTDDPRRVYRAILLAVKYDLNIHEDIKKFILDNTKNLFSYEKAVRDVPDSYITLHIDKSLKIDPVKTINILRDLNLLSTVPLVGTFKDFVVKNHLLSEYFNYEDLLKGNKKKMASANIAKDWDSYSKQGDEYKKIMDWWKLNSSKLGLSSDYNSWKNWYMNELETSWGGKHKGPEDVLILLNKTIKDDRAIRLSKIEEIKDKEINNDTKKNKIKILNLSGKYPGLNVKNGINIDDVSDKTKIFLNTLSKYVEDNNLERPIINSGYRSVKSQVNIMFSNWKLYGGNNGGRQYLESLYSKKYGKQMSDIFEANSDGEVLSSNGFKLAFELASKHTGGHTTLPAYSIDISNRTNDVFSILKHVKEQLIGNVNVEIADETIYKKNPHYHITIK